ncbi:MAG: SpoIIE family protein phosphatase, partial [bacterium]|nr:SpoIIE family protein phosphatase [bacterium]
MLLNLTEYSNEPLHNQISRQIWEKILAGDINENENMLPVRTLARTHHISTLTVVRAYDDLVKEGILNRNESTHHVAVLSKEKKQEIALRRLFKVDTSLNIIDTFSNQLKSVFDLDRLYEILKTSVKSHFNISDVLMTVYDPGSSGYRILSDGSSERETIIDINDPIIKELAQINIPTEIENLNRPDKESLLDIEIEKRGMKIVFPLKDEDTLLGVLALPGKKSGNPFTKEDFGVLTILSNQFATALITARYYVETVEKKRFEEELSLASKIQQDLLPKELPDNEEFQIAAYSKPSFRVGGDFYDYLPIDEDRFGLVIADACGKGMPAAMLISQIQAILKGEAGSGKPIIQILKHLNKHIKKYTSAQNFTTLFFGIYNRKTGVLEFANAGHNYPVIIRKDGSKELLITTGPALGITTDDDYFVEN